MAVDKFESTVNDKNEIEDSGLLGYENLRKKLLFLLERGWDLKKIIVMLNRYDSEEYDEKWETEIEFKFLGPAS